MNKWTLVQLLSHIWLFETSWTVAHQASLPSTISWSFLKLMSIEFGDVIQPSHPLTLPFPPAFNLSQHQGLFHWFGSFHQVVKILELQHQNKWIVNYQYFQVGTTYNEKYIYEKYKVDESKLYWEWSVWKH